MCGDGGKADRERRKAKRDQKRLENDMRAARETAQRDADRAIAASKQQSEDYKKSLAAMQATQPKYTPPPQQVNTTQASAGRSPIIRQKTGKTKLSTMRIKLKPTVNTSAGGKTGSNIG